MIYYYHKNIIGLIASLTNGHIRPQGSCCMECAECNIAYLFTDFQESFYIDFSLISKVSDCTVYFSVFICGDYIPICDLPSSVVFMDSNEFNQYYKNKQTAFKFREIVDLLLQAKDNTIRMIDFVKNNFYCDIAISSILHIKGRLFSKKWICTVYYCTKKNKFVVSPYYSTNEQKIEIGTPQEMNLIECLLPYKRAYFCC